jgi:hypothetical protein
MKRLLNIQQKLKAPKSSDNKFGGYKYRSAEQILQAVKPMLEEEKLVLTLSDDIVAVGNRIYVKAVATLKDINGIEIGYTMAFAREDEALKGMTQSQITGAASSYARKYALNGLFAIDNTDDPDALNDGNITMMSASQKKLLDDLNTDWQKALEYLELDSIDEITEAQAAAMINAKLKQKAKDNA